MLAPDRPSHPTYYEIRVEGRLHEGWARRFADMTLSVEVLEGGPTTTVLRGPVADRAALHGLLSRIRDLGLHLVLVRRIDCGE